MQPSKAIDGHETKLENPKRQIIHFIGGVKRTIDGVVGVWENEWCHIYTTDDREWIINKSNVLMVEVINVK